MWFLAPCYEILATGVLRAWLQSQNNLLSCSAKRVKHVHWQRLVFNENRAHCNNWTFECFAFDPDVWLFDTQSSDMATWLLVQWWSALRSLSSGLKHQLFHLIKRARHVANLTVLSYVANVFSVPSFVWCRFLLSLLCTLKSTSCAPTTSREAWHHSCVSYK